VRRARLLALVTAGLLVSAPSLLHAGALDAYTRAAKDGRETGLRAARELLLAIRTRVAGAYLIPSFGRYDRIIDLVREVRTALPAR